jgi:TRAP-type uncharacterized transport system substrate-binding protein
MDAMKNLQTALPFWVRAILLVGVVCILAGAGLISYRYYAKPKTLTIAVGSLDGEAKQLAQLIASRLATTDAPIRLKVVNAGSVLDAAVVGGEINHGVVDVLKKEYDLGHANVTFKDIAPLDARRAIQAKEVSALLLVVPLTERYLSLVKGLFRESPNSSPVLIPIDAAGAIADAKGPYESFDIPKGTLRGAPPVPDDDVTTLRVGFYLVANRHLSATLVGDLTKKLMSVRRDLIGEQPLLAGIAAPDTDPDAFLAVHPGAAAFYNGTQESFKDRYSNAIYLTPMVLGAMASVFAAAWRFLGVRPVDGAQTTLDTLCGLPKRVRKTDDEAELAAIEEEIDTILHGQLARSADSEEGASETHALIAAAHRLDNLIHHRRMALVARAPPQL